MQIDLGDYRQPPETLPERPTSRFAPLGLLSLLLAASLAGSARAEPPPRQTVVPARLGESVLFGGDRMFVVRASAPDPSSADRYVRILDAYALPGAEPAGHTTVAVAGSVSQAREIGDVTLVEHQVYANSIAGVAAVRTGTDQVLWRQSGQLVGASGADGVVLLGSTAGNVAVDLTTGRTLWTVPAPRAGYLAQAGPVGDDGFPRWLVSATDAGHLEVRDAHTGAILITRAVPGLPGGTIFPVGDLVLVQNRESSFNAYRLPGLERQWHSSVDLSTSWIRTDCGGVICAFRGQNGMTAIDPATGRELWEADRWTYADPIGDRLLATRAGGGNPSLYVLDKRTGSVLGSFGSWHELGPAPGATVYGMRYDPVTYELWYSVLDPATLRVRVLGSIDRVSGDCHTAAGVLVCRLVDASVVVRRLG